MSEYKLSIKTIADLKALTATKAGLEEAAKATKALGKDTSALEQEIKKVDAALAGESAQAVKAADSLKKAIAATKQTGGDTSPLKQQLGGIQKQYGLPSGNFLMDQAAKLPGVGGMISNYSAAGGGVAAAGAAFAAAAKGVNEYAQAQQRVAGLDAALAQTGLLTDQYREHLQGLAGELQKTTGVADDKWIGVLAKLTQFGAKPETIGMDVEAVKNLAGLLNGDVEQAAQAYSRALQGNFEMFGRLGIRIDENASKTEKLKQLQELAAQRGGGQLEASNNTLIGQWNQLKNGLNDLFEAGGRWIAQTGVLQTVLFGLGRTAAYLAEQFGGVIPRAEGLRNALAAQAVSADEADAALKRHSDRVAEEIKLSQAYEDALKREVAAIQAKQRAQDEIVDARLAQDLAGVDTLQQNGGIGVSEAIARRAELRAVADETKLENARQAATKTIAINEERIKQINDELAAKTAELAEAEQAKKGGDEITAGRIKIQQEAEAKRKFWQGQKEGLEAFEKMPIASGLMPNGYPVGDSGITVSGKSQMSSFKGHQAIADALAAVDAEEKKRLTDYDKGIVQPNTAAGLSADQKRRDLESRQPVATKEINDLTAQNQQLMEQLNLQATKQSLIVPTAQLLAAGARQKAQRDTLTSPLSPGTDVTQAFANLQGQLAELNNRTAAALNAAANALKTTGALSAQKLQEIKDAQDRFEQLFKLQQQQTGDLKPQMRHRD
ncbi:MAG: hypothetical protein ACO1QS_16565 [Verrucomicrobiota bacterium]